MYRIVNPIQSHQEFRGSVQLAALQELLSDEEIDGICQEFGHKWRERELPPAVTARSMVYRALNSDRSIPAVLADLAAGGAVSSATLTDSAWCQARSRLPLVVWVELLQRSARRLRRLLGKEHLFFGRPVYLVDGSTLSMPDEPELVETFGYAPGKHGPSRFPVARITFITLAGTEAVWDYRMDDYYASEDGQFHDMWHTLPAGSICLFDRHFSSFYNLAKLRHRHIGVLCPLHQRRDPQKLIAEGRKIGKDEWIVPLKLAPQLRKEYDDPSLPEVLWVRLIRVPWRRGEKRKRLWLVSTLMDPVRYPRKELIRLYRQRWGIETRIGSIKVTLELTVLRSKRAANVRREVAAAIVGHNLVWTLMHQAAEQTETPADRISFAGAVKAVLSFSTCLRHAPPPQRHHLYKLMLEHIASNTNRYRPGRMEPRRVKRDPVRYPFLTTTREKARQECLS
ncbi:MAG: IS4 family transposase [Phycisphaerae bacterium]